MEKRRNLDLAEKAAWDTFTGPNTIVIAFNGADEPTRAVHGDIRCFSQAASPMIFARPVLKFRPRAKRSSLGEDIVNIPTPLDMMRTKESAREGLDKWSVMESEVGNKSVERGWKPLNPAFQTLQCTKT